MWIVFIPGLQQEDGWSSAANVWMGCGLVRFLRILIPRQDTFLLPQKEPDFYDTFTYTYNLPELIKAPVKTGKKLLETIEEPIHRAKVKN